MDDVTSASLREYALYKRIAASARWCGLDVNTATVGMHSRRFTEWWEGVIDTDYLVKTTGIKRLQEEDT